MYSICQSKKLYSLRHLSTKYILLISGSPYILSYSHLKGFDCFWSVVEDNKLDIKVIAKSLQCYNMFSFLHPTSVSSQNGKRQRGVDEESNGKKEKLFRHLTHKSISVWLRLPFHFHNVVSSYPFSRRILFYYYRKCVISALNCLRRYVNFFKELVLYILTSIG